MSVLDGERPGGEQRRRAAVDERLGGCPQPLAVPRPVVSACALGHRDHGRCLGQRDGQSAQVLGEVKRLDPLVGETGKAAVEVGERLTPAEPGDGVGGQADAGARELRFPQPAGHHDLSRRSPRPQPVHVGGGGHAVEHHRPAALGAAQPGEETLRGPVSGSGGGGTGGPLLAGQRRKVRVRPRVTGDDRAPVARGNPDQQVDRLGGPHRVRESDGELGLAGPARTQRRRDEEDSLAWPQTVGQPEPGLLARVVKRGKRRNRSGEDRCPGPLSTHVRCLPHAKPCRGHPMGEIVLKTACRREIGPGGPPPPLPTRGRPR